jgi:hypothetical protein
MSYRTFRDRAGLCLPVFLFCTAPPVLYHTVFSQLFFTPLLLYHTGGVYSIVTISVFTFTRPCGILFPTERQ